MALVWCMVCTRHKRFDSRLPVVWCLGCRTRYRARLAPVPQLTPCPGAQVARRKGGIRAGPSGSQDGDPFSSEWQDKRDREASPAPNRMRLFFRFSYGARQCCLCSNYQVARWIKVKGTGRFTTLDDLIDPKEKSARNAHLVAELRGHDGRVTSDFDNFPFGFSRKTRCKSINQLK